MPGFVFNTPFPRRIADLFEFFSHGTLIFSLASVSFGSTRPLLVSALATARCSSNLFFDDSVFPPSGSVFCVTPHPSPCDGDDLFAQSLRSSAVLLPFSLTPGGLACAILVMPIFSVFLRTQFGRNSAQGLFSGAFFPPLPLFSSLFSSFWLNAPADFSFG